MAEKVKAMPGPDKIGSISLEVGTNDVGLGVRIEVILDEFRNLIKSPRTRTSGKLPEAFSQGLIKQSLSMLKLLMQICDCRNCAMK